MYMKWHISRLFRGGCGKVSDAASNLHRVLSESYTSRDLKGKRNESERSISPGMIFHFYSSLGSSSSDRRKYPHADTGVYISFANNSVPGELTQPFVNRETCLRALFARCYAGRISLRFSAYGACLLARTRTLVKPYGKSLDLRRTGAAKCTVTLVRNAKEETRRHNCKWRLPPVSEHRIQLDSEEKTTPRLIIPLRWQNKGGRNNKNCEK